MYQLNTNVVFYAAKIPGSITFDREFTNELTDKTSAEYQAVARESEHEVTGSVLLIGTPISSHCYGNIVNSPI